MSEFLVSTQILTKSNATPVFMRAARASKEFGKTADKSFDQASRASKDFTRDFIRGLDRVENKVAGFRGVTGGVLGADVIREGFRRATMEVGSFVSEAAKVESAEVVFKRFAGGVREGKRLVSDLRELAARTPFEFNGLADVSKLLLSMDAATRENLIPTLRMLGDTAGGNQDRFNRLAFAFAEVASNTKASFQEIRQFTNAQVPVLRQLIKQWGKSPEEVRKMIKAGRATFPEILKAFRAMTKEGGMFFRGMEDASRTFEGRMSTLRDNIKLTKSTIGMQLLPILKDYVDRGIRIAQITAEWAINNKDLIRTEFTKWLTTTEQIMRDLWPIAKGVFQAFSSMLPVVRALSPILPVLAGGWLANKFALKGLALFELVHGLIKMKAAVRGLTVAQWLWNASIIANPYALVITAIIVGLTAVVAAIVLAVKHWDALTDFMKKSVMAVGNFLVREFWGWARILFIPLIRSIQGLAALGAKAAEALGRKTLAKELRGVVTQFDNLDWKMKRAAGQFDNVIKKGREFAKVFDKELTFKIKAPSLERFAPAPGLIEFAGLTAPTAAVPRPAFETRGGEDDPLARLRDFQIGLKSAAPGVEGEAGTSKEYKIRLDIAGAPEGSKVKTDAGSSAPPIEVNLLGIN